MGGPAVGGAPPRRMSCRPSRFCTAPKNARRRSPRGARNRSCPPSGPPALLHEYPLRVGRRGPHFSGPSAGATLRGCSRRFIPTYKTKYRVANWAAYNQALVRRGDVTVWVSSEAIAAWTPRRSGRRGGQQRYSDLAIETALTLRLLYHLPLRQAEGFLHALFGMMRLDLAAPDYTTLSRRSQHLQRRLRPIPPGEGLHLVLDSTGLSLVGAGEWAAAKHGGRGRRGRCCMKICGWGGLARISRDPPQEPHYRDEVEGPSHV